MMENIADIWKETKDRISNPFIFSFVLLWLVYNWQIPIAILFLDKSDYQIEGHSSLTSYIRAQIPEVKFWKPVGFAAIYCLIFGASKEIIRVINAAFNRAGSWAYYEISKESSMNFDDYVKQSNEIDQKKKEIEAIHKKAKEIQLARDKAEDQNRELTKVIEETNKRLANLQLINDSAAEQNRSLIDENRKLEMVTQDVQKALASIKDLSLINGTWTIAEPDTPWLDSLEISNGLIIEDDIQKNIQQFYHSPESSIVTFFTTDKTNRYTHYVLKFYGDNTLEGTKNGLHYKLTKNIKNNKTPR